MASFDYDGPLPNTTTLQLIHAHSSKELIMGGGAKWHGMLCCPAEFNDMHFFKLQTAILYRDIPNHRVKRIKLRK